MTEMSIRSMVTMLSKSLGGVREPINTTYPEMLFLARKYTEVVGFVRGSMKLDMCLSVGYVNRGGPANAVAWADPPQNMPLYGTVGFRSMRINMFIRKEFLRESAHVFLRVTAHEMSHIVLNDMYHQLRKNEKAVDIAAMVLGYRDVLAVAAQPPLRTLGQLTPEETLFVQALLSQR